MAINDTNRKRNVNKYASKPRHEVRRKEYAVDDDVWIESLLTRSLYGTLGTVYETQPFLTPLLFVYAAEEHAIYFHGAQMGRLRANIEMNPNVCFNVTEVGRVLPREKAVNFNIEYDSVIIFGKAQPIRDKKEVGRLLQRIMNKYTPQLKPNVGYIPAQPEDIDRTLVVKITIEDWTGKQQRDDGEAINPYYYDPMPVIRRTEE
ncbi:MAG: pyridoxamine 5'-phosphate oxidase family protein [Anaerolineales bacterium]|jgi:nitroimidazol reductase NimA-like FMN-containing flavoprotein (pyridoxamine 5'-phosphate oxidase superfamily)